MASPSKWQYYLFVLIFASATLNVVSQLYSHCTYATATKSDSITDFEATALRIARHLNDLTAVTGIAPQPGDTACDYFECPAEHQAIRTSKSVDDVLNRTVKKVYCRCVPVSDARLLNLVLRTADLISSSTAVQVNFKRLHDHLHEVQDRVEATLHKAQTISRKPRALPRSALPDTNLTYVPPPKTDVTPYLLAESLAVQPQDTATIGSVMPYFQDGVISYGVQLNGLVATTMTLNASTSLPCANIGSSGQAQPDLILRPKDVDNGTAQPYIPDCNIIAVNMYDPDVIHYWIMNPTGAILSLVGSNKLEQIDQLNSTASMSLVLRAISSSSTKRDETTAALHDGDEITKRAMSQPDIHTASMTAAACAAMKCNNNGGQAAVFNPFTSTCWCQDPAYVEIEHV